MINDFPFYVGLEIPLAVGKEWLREIGWYKEMMPKHFLEDPEDLHLSLDTGAIHCMYGAANQVNREIEYKRLGGILARLGNNIGLKSIELEFDSLRYLGNTGSKVGLCVSDPDHQAELLRVAILVSDALQRNGFTMAHSFQKHWLPHVNLLQTVSKGNRRHKPLDLPHFDLPKTCTVDELCLIFNPSPRSEDIAHNPNASVTYRKKRK